MIALLTRESTRAIDIDAVEKLGIPTIVLMENAAIGVMETMARKFPELLSRVAIIGGPGQNGGDGWALARHLVNRGARPRPFLVGSEDKIGGDARINWEAMRKLGLPVRSSAADGLKSIDTVIEGASLVVDALFGTGLDRAIQGVYAEAISAINQCAVPCVALDLPSGVDADTGQVLGSAVRARVTVTFAALKRGLFQHPGAELAGEIVPVSIGVPGPAPHSPATLIERSDVADWLAPRSPSTHKGYAGDLLVIAGSPGRTGAALLSGMGALRSGAGLVTIAARGDASQALDAKVIELMTAALPIEASVARQKVLEYAKARSAAVVGPGLGLDKDGRELARSLAVDLPIPAVLDADALTSIDTDLALLKNAAGARVLTPHPGEAARLLGSSSADIQANRYLAAVTIASQSGCVVALKGAATVIAEPAGRMRVCPFGTPALGVAGTGDVLSGVIGSLLAHLSAFDAASAGVALHALAGEISARSDRGLFAREVADALPAALEICRGRAR
jgi:ADP-dependent NAD(P)H-hydrate dehydratase / NAD(P)H-hydrate epimerase